MPDADLPAPADKPTAKSTAKKPRRTAERILEVTLDLFNRFGEPNVSTTLISAELGISPGNLYYHYPAKDELINALFDRYERGLNDLLHAADNVRNVEDAWLFFHMLFELIWAYRFLYRDLNDLLSKNRRLETHFQFVLKNKSRAVAQVLDGLTRGSSLRIDRRERGHHRGHTHAAHVEVVAAAIETARVESVAGPFPHLETVPLDADVNFRGIGEGGMIVAPAALVTLPLVSYSRPG